MAAILFEAVVSQSGSYIDPHCIKTPIWPFTVICMETDTHPEGRTEGKLGNI